MQELKIVVHALSCRRDSVDVESYKEALSAEFAEFKVSVDIYFGDSDAYYNLGYMSIAFNTPISEEMQNRVARRITETYQKLAAGSAARE